MTIDSLLEAICRHGVQYQHCLDPDCNDELDGIDRDDEDEEWQEGTCDNCYGSTPEELAAAANGPGFVPVCACAIGQGAGPGECQCGPENEEG